MENMRLLKHVSLTNNHAKVKSENTTVYLKHTHTHTNLHMFQIANPKNETQHLGPTWGEREREKEKGIKWQRGTACVFDVSEVV